MADRCVCGHEEREHDRGDAMGDECHVCGCEDYRRSPLSAFRGPAVRFTREEAAGWLFAIRNSLGRVRSDALGYPDTTAVGGEVQWSAHRITYDGLDPRAEARRIVALIRDPSGGRSELRHTQWTPVDVQALYLAARILRAVRP